MIEVIINGSSKKSIEIETYKKDLKILGDPSKLEIMIYALKQLSKSKNYSRGNPFFIQVNNIKNELTEIMETVTK